MSDSDTVILKDANLKKLIKALKGNLPTVRVGILGGFSGRNDSKQTNATIGAKHEFGLDGMPQRSFLRMPLALQLNKNLSASRAFDKETLLKVVQDGSIVLWMKKVGVVAENTIQDAFDSGGFGQWKPSNMALKTNHQTLVETQQLRNSITSEVKE